MTEDERQAAFKLIEKEFHARYEALKEKYKGNGKHGRVPDDEVNKLHKWAEEEIKKLI